MSANDDHDPAICTKPRNTRWPELWFGRMLSVVAGLFILAGTVAGLVWFEITGAEAVKLLTEGFWAFMLIVLLYNGRAVIHDRIADLIRSLRGRA